MDRAGGRARATEEETGPGSGSDYGRFPARLQAGFAAGAAQLRAGVQGAGKASPAGAGPCGPAAGSRFFGGRDGAPGPPRGPAASHPSRREPHATLRFLT